MRRIAVDLGGKAVVLCDVAETPTEQARGLQGRPVLFAGEGLLFPFDPARATLFHIAAVSYPIDIIFVGVDRRIAKIVHKAQPGTPDRWFHTPTAAVVEVPGGYSERIGLKLGDYVWFPMLGRSAMRPLDILTGITDGGDRDEMHSDRYKNVGLPDDVDPNAQEDDDAFKHWDSSQGFDISHPDMLNSEGPGYRPAFLRKALDISDVIVEIVDDISASGLQWRSSPLTGGRVLSAVITLHNVRRWLEEYPDYETAELLGEPGLQILGDALVLTGVADTAEVADDKLILWRGKSNEA